MALPALIDVGQRDLLLPPGTHKASVADVEAAFVNTTPQYIRRVELWERYLQFRTLLLGLLPIEQEFLDGSFVTSRQAPKDTDASFWVQATAIEKLSPAGSAALTSLLERRMESYDCDAYLVTPCSQSHPAHEYYQFWKKRTEAGWSSYKNRAKMVVPGMVKGYVEVV